MGLNFAYTEEGIKLQKRSIKISDNVIEAWLSHLNFILEENGLIIPDTNVLINHLFSGFLLRKLKEEELSKLAVGIISGVVWELEDMANRDKFNIKARQAKSAFRDLILIRDIMNYIFFSYEYDRNISMGDTNADRIIRSQIKKVQNEIKPKPVLFLTFDQISSLSAQAEGIDTIFIPTPPIQNEWKLDRPNFSKLKTLSLLLREIAEDFGCLYFESSSYKGFILGDWGGKLSDEWTRGVCCIEPSKDLNDENDEKIKKIKEFFKQ